MLGKHPTDPRASLLAVVDFWTWWQTARPGVETALAAKTPSRFEQSVARAVAAIHPELKWEIGGRPDAYQFIVTGHGIPEMRAVAARWQLAAPKDDSRWSYFSSRQPDPRALAGTRLTIVGRSVALSEMTVSLCERRDQARVDVVVHHDVFAALPRDDGKMIADLALGWALGEDEIERRLGRITTSSTSESSAATIAMPDLAAAIAEFGARHPPAFALVQGVRGDGRPIVGVVLTGYGPVDYPLFDLHIVVTVPYVSMNSERFQIGESADRLSSFEESLSYLCGSSAVMLAALSCDGMRMLHLYCDATSDVSERVRGWRHGWAEGDVRIEVNYDPAWAAIGAVQT
jgi:hypothetical protein